MRSRTIFDVFVLVGFSYLNELQLLLFVVVLVIYLLTLMGNLLVILLIKLSSSLHTPMYFFLVNLSASEICFTSSVVPQLLAHLLVEEKTISIAACAAGVYVSAIMGFTQCCLLTAMAYDRYVAICHPLHYTTIMRGRIKSVGSMVTVVFTLCHFLLILLSYARIISTILKLPSAEGRRKAFSTCSSHLTVVTVFYGTSLITYLVPKAGSTTESDLLISLLNTIVSPVLNPIIYTLKNKEVKGALRKTVQKSSFSHHWRN
ncbi:olfactory receptor 2D3-like [Carettochelys insculpta]|uniref:olfactory receptor 2D3-like n=1 Tax=Carettochelys insculpta TaxID=44489 RepID=UPI003EBDC7A8